MMKKLKVTSGLLQDFLSSSRGITWNPKSNCTCREKNHFLFRSSTSTSPERHIHHSMYCWRKYLRLLESRWRKRIIRCMDRLSHQKDTHGPGRDSQGNKEPLVLMMSGQICGSICPMQRKRKQNKDGAIEKPKLDNAQKITCSFLFWTWWWKIHACHESRS